MYRGWLYRLGSAGGVSSVDPCAREKVDISSEQCKYKDNNLT